MNVVQRFLSNKDNRIANAVLTTSAIRAAAASWRLRPETREGLGLVRLTGSFTGPRDSTYEVEITGETVGAVPQWSQPILKGAGNGSISDVSVDAGTTAQTFTIALRDAGTVTTFAEATVDGQRIVARASGEAGNGITITETTTTGDGLTFTATPAAALQELSAGTDELLGPEWDFGGRPLRSDGTLHPSTPRISFGDDRTVYRQYSEFRDGKTFYRLTPALVRAVPLNAVVYAVTGSRSVLVEGFGGTPSEDFTGIVTMFDFFNAIRSSAMVDLDGVAVADTRPGGQAALDFQPLTGALALPAVPSSASMPALLNVEAVATAESQAVLIEVINADTPGAETWNVVGRDGLLGTATTGTAYSDDVLTFEPQPYPYIPGREAITLTGTQYAGRDDGEDTPPIGLLSTRLGAAARSKTLQLTYRERPNLTDCDPAEAPIRGRIRNSLLGLEGQDVTIPVEILDRWKLMYEWWDEFVQANTKTVDIGTPFYYDINDSDAVNNRYVFHGSFFPQSGLTDSFATEKKYVVSSPEDLAIVKPTFEDLKQLLVDIFEIPDALTAWDGIWSTFKADMASLREPILDREVSFVLGSQVGNNWDGVLINTSSAPQSPTLEEIFLDRTSSGTEDANSRAWTYDGAIENYFTVNQLAATVENRDPGYFDRYKSAIDKLLIDAGIDPGKADAQIGAAWTDLGDGFWWEFDGQEYLPAFTNAVYHAAKRDATGTTFPTQEFAFAIAVKCSGDLREGDSITITIDAGAGRGAYAVGDSYAITIIAGAPITLAGGDTGTDEKTWSVSGSVDGAFPDYVQTASPPPYNDDIGFRITDGGVPFALGDSFTFDVEGGQFRWRRDEGAWSAAIDIGTAAVALDSGLSALFLRSDPPSFVTGDVFTFDVTQPYSVDGIMEPSDSKFEWTSGAVAVTADLDVTGVVPVDALCIARHSIPQGATITVQGSDDAFATTLWTEVLTWSKGPIVKLIDRPDVSHLRLNVSSPSRIGWWYAGEASKLSIGAQEITYKRGYQMARGPRRASFAGSGIGGRVAWRDFLTPDDQAELLAIVDHSKESGDEPLVFVPNIVIPSEAWLVVPQADTLEITDRSHFQTPDIAKRLLSAALEFAPVIE